MSPTSPFTQRASRLALGLTAVLGVVFALRPIDDFDVWYHLAAGRLIATTWHWPVTNTFAYTVPDHPWIDLHWVFQLLLYAVYAVGGANGCIVLAALLVLATIVILSLAARRFAPDTLVAALVGVAIVVASTRFVPRPELVSFVLFAAYLWILDGFPANGRALYWLVPLQALWANSQGIFAVGLVVIACYWAGATLAFLPLPRGWRTASGASAAEWRRLTVVLALATAACLLNPYGLQGALFPIDLLPRVTGSSLFSARIGEFRAPFESGYGVPLAYTWAAMLVLAAASFLVAIRRVHLGRLFVTAAFGLLSTQALRNVALFAWVAVPAIAANLGPLFTRPTAPVAATRTERRRADGAHAAAAPARLATALAPLATGAVVVVLALLIASVVTNRFSRFLDIEREFGLGVSTLHFPIAAEQFARDVGIGGRPFNCLVAGGYLAWRRFPEERVFVDGRLEAYPEEFFQSYFDVLDNPENWPAVAARYAPEYVILYHVWSNRLPLARYLSDGHGWAMVYYDETASLYLPTDEAHRALRERAAREFAARRAQAEPPAVASSMWRALVVPVAALRRDTSYGAFLMAMGDADAAVAAYTRALAIDPGVSSTRFALGMAQWSAGRPERAVVEWRDTLRRDPSFEPARNALAEAEQQMRGR
jgi:tetratricopeptide (TPR) repeat protein